MNLTTPSSRYAAVTAAGLPFPIAAVPGPNLGLDELIVGGSELQEYGNAAIELTGLRLHCSGAQALETSEQHCAGERRLVSLAQTLCAPFRSHDDDYILELSEIEIAVAPIGSPMRGAADHLVQYAYGLRHLGGAGANWSEHQDRERDGEAATLVALAQQRGAPQVIGTMRFVVSDELGVLDCFAPDPTTCWPHAFGTPAELSRLAFHPIFNRMGQATGGLQRDLTRFYKLLCLRKLASHCVHEIRSRGAQVIYFVGTPDVVRSLSTGGIQLDPLPGAHPVDSDTSRRAREAAPRYWQPEQPEQQPIPYLLAAELDEITVPIGQHRIVIAPDNSLRLAAIDEGELAAAAA
jgi:hypothetical protein